MTTQQRLKMPPGLELVEDTDQQEMAAAVQAAGAIGAQPGVRTPQPPRAGLGAGIVSPSAATSMMLLAFSALSRRFVIALANLFMLVTIGSAFFLWYQIPNPNVYQLIGLGMYAVFILLINLIRARHHQAAGV